MFCLRFNVYDYGDLWQSRTFSILKADDIIETVSMISFCLLHMAIRVLCAWMILFYNYPCVILMRKRHNDIIESSVVSHYFYPLGMIEIHLHSDLFHTISLSRSEIAEQQCNAMQRSSETAFECKLTDMHRPRWVCFCFFNYPVKCWGFDSLFEGWAASLSTLGLSDLLLVTDGGVVQHEHSLCSTPTTPTPQWDIHKTFMVW